MRVEAGYKQEEMAQYAGISNATITRIENGASYSIESLFRIMRALGIIQNLEIVIPDNTMATPEEIHRYGRARQRVTDKKVKENKKAVKWGDEK